MIEELFNKLEKGKVEYIIIGGFASKLYGM